MPRVVSLLGSATEIVAALGCEDALVGRSHECDFPPAVQRLPVCTEPKFRLEGTSGEIDRRVTTLVRDALSIYRVHTETLKALRPGLILTQSHCEVCAVSLRDVEDAVGMWLEGRPRIVSLQPNALADVWRDMGRVAEALGVTERGRALVEHLQRRMDAIAAQAQAIPERPRVVCIEWMDPLMTAGNWMPELIELAGGVSCLGEAGRHSPRVTWEELEAADPEVMLILPCGFSIDRSRQDLPRLTAHPTWPRLRAVQGGRVAIADGNHYFNRPGPRLAESLEILAELLHPGHFRFGHEGSGWQRL